MTDVIVDKQPGAPMGLQLEDAGRWWLLQPTVVMVAGVEATSGAALTEGDQIVSVNGVDVSSARATAELIRAVGGAVTIGVVRKAAAPSHAHGIPVRLALAVGLLFLCLRNLWSVHSARQASRLHEQARTDATQWRTIAKAEAERLEVGRREHQSLSDRASELQRKIRLLKHANASAASRVREALASLRAQQRNVTEQRRAWRQAQHKAQQQLNAAGKHKASLSEALAAERHRTKQVLKELSEARAEAAASLRAERATAHRIKQLVIQRMGAAAAELEEMAKAGGLPELSKEAIKLAALVGQRDTFGGGGGGSRSRRRRSTTATGGGVQACSNARGATKSSHRSRERRPLHGGCSALRHQSRWTAYVLTMNSSGTRFAHVRSHLECAGIRVVAQPGVRVNDTTSYLGGTLAIFNAWQAIAADEQLAPSDYALVFEDDVSPHPRLSHGDIRPILSYAAYLSTDARLPFFYAGLCGQSLYSRFKAIFDVGPSVTVHGADVDDDDATVSDGGTLRGPMRRLGAGGLEVQYARATGGCTHAYAVRRSSALWLLNLTRPTIHESKECQGLDIMLMPLVHSLGGVYAPAANLRSPHPNPGSFGLYFQDRDRFRSVTTTKQHLLGNRCQQAVSRFLAAKLPLDETVHAPYLGLTTKGYPLGREKILHPAAGTGKFQGKVLKSGRFVRVSAKANTSETAFRGPRLFRDGVFIVRLDQHIFERYFSRGGHSPVRQSGSFVEVSARKAVSSSSRSTSPSPQPRGGHVVVGGQGGAGEGKAPAGDWASSSSLNTTRFFEKHLGWHGTAWAVEQTGPLAQCPDLATARERLPEVAAGPLDLLVIDLAQRGLHVGGGNRIGLVNFQQKRHPEERSFAFAPATAAACAVPLLIARTSKCCRCYPHVTYPNGTTSPAAALVPRDPARFGCYVGEPSGASPVIWTDQRCAGLFQCSNGERLLCESSRSGERINCTCSPSRGCNELQLLRTLDWLRSPVSVLVIRMSQYGDDQVQDREIRRFLTEVGRMRNVETELGSEGSQAGKTAYDVWIGPHVQSAPILSTQARALDWRVDPQAVQGGLHADMLARFQRASSAVANLNRSMASHLGSEGSHADGDHDSARTWCTFEVTEP